MQNKCNNCGAGYVSLSGAWNCGGCGWSNCDCDACANCGWNRWGCNNGCNNTCGCSNGCVVSVGETRNNGRRGDDCRHEDRACEQSNAGRERAYHSRTTDCGCSDDCPVQTCKMAAECCDDNIGRLDMNSDGLLLLTDDGELANRLTHPKHEIPKIYRVTVKEFRARFLFLKRCPARAGR